MIQRKYYPLNQQSQLIGSHSGTEQIQLFSVQNTAVGRCRQTYHKELSLLHSLTLYMAFYLTR